MKRPTPAKRYPLDLADVGLLAAVGLVAWDDGCGTVWFLDTDSRECAGHYCERTRMHRVHPWRPANSLSLSEVVRFLSLVRGRRGT